MSWNSDANHAQSPSFAGKSVGYSRDRGFRWCFDKCRQRPLGVNMNRVGSTGARGGPVYNGRPALGGEGGGGGPPKEEAVVGRQKYEDRSIKTITVTTSVSVLGCVLGVCSS